jgi:hypothetical protein
MRYVDVWLEREWKDDKRKDDYVIKWFNQLSSHLNLMTINKENFSIVIREYTCRIENSNNLFISNRV